MNLKDVSTEELIKELKKRGLGVFPLDYPFMYTQEQKSS